MYLIIKASRAYNGGLRGYEGPTWDMIDMAAQGFADKDEALSVAARMSAANPVGFDVVEAVELPDNGTIDLPCASGTRSVSFVNGERVREVIVRADGSIDQLLPIPAHIQKMIDAQRA